MENRETPNSIDLTPQPLHRLLGALKGLTEGKLWRKVLVALALGVLAGFALGPDVGWASPSFAAVAIKWIGLPGNLFLAAIQMIVIPLIFASIIGGLAASDDTAQLRALGLRSGVYFAATSLVAITIGIGLALLLRPGSLIQRAALGPSALDSEPVEEVDMPGISEIPQVLVGLLPDNPVASVASGQMLEIVLFACVVGVALVVMPKAKAAPLLDLLESTQGVCMTVVEGVMRFAPIAVFGLTVPLTATVGLGALLGMAAYVGTVLLGLAILVTVYVIAAGVLGGQKPRAFLSAARPAQLLGFSTSSSAAVMPLSMATAERELGVRPELARFVIPLGATINMDGTALYQGVATVFLAQVYGVELGIGALALVVITAVAASIGAPAAPGVGIVILAGVLQNAGIPSSGIALLLGVDRLLDMARTSVNITGDLTASVVLDRWLSAKPSPSKARVPAA